MGRTACEGPGREAVIGLTASTGQRDVHLRRHTCPARAALACRTPAVLPNTTAMSTPISAGRCMPHTPWTSAGGPAPVALSHARAVEGTG